MRKEIWEEDVECVPNISTLDHKENDMKSLSTALTGSLFTLALLAPGAMALAAEHEAETTERHEAETTEMHMEASFVTHKSAGHMESDDLVGSTVKSTAEEDEDIGSVDKLLIDESGQVTALVLSIGGFLGMGEKDIAIAWESLDITHEDDDLVIRVNATQDALENAPEYEGEE
ncbi:PRC-barrel domain-containing protein [Halomonas sp. HK25]|uniref:PRC-barrel domain-containing protein n=1 Tax=Halomonas sp. HK25 TaxID=3394321 RepID=UPI0039FC6D85